MENKIAKLSASVEADQALDRMTAKTNEGFSGGKVPKHDMLSWILIFFERHHFDDCLDKVRKDHFDQVAYLESVVKEMKKARKNGEAQPDLNTLLAPIATQLKSISAQKKLRLESKEEGSK